jgi:hypothetical protein
MSETVVDVRSDVASETVDASHASKDHAEINVADALDNVEVTRNLDTVDTVDNVEIHYMGRQHSAGTILCVESTREAEYIEDVANVAVNTDAFAEIAAQQTAISTVTSEHIDKDEKVTTVTQETQLVQTSEETVETGVIGTSLAYESVGGFIPEASQEAEFSTAEIKADNKAHSTTHVETDIVESVQESTVEQTAVSKTELIRESRELTSEETATMIVSETSIEQSAASIAYTNEASQLREQHSPKQSTDPNRIDVETIEAAEFANDISAIHDNPSEDELEQKADTDSEFGSSVIMHSAKASISSYATIEEFHDAYASLDAGSYSVFDNMSGVQESTTAERYNNDVDPKMFRQKLELDSHDQFAPSDYDDYDVDDDDEHNGYPSLGIHVPPPLSVTFQSEEYDYSDNENENFHDADEHESARNTADNIYMTGEYNNTFMLASPLSVPQITIARPTNSENGEESVLMTEEYINYDNDSDYIGSADEERPPPQSPSMMAFISRLKELAPSQEDENLYNTSHSAIYSDEDDGRDAEEQLDKEVEERLRNHLLMLENNHLRQNDEEDDPYDNSQ